jgi:PAS domain S-box-containing protein
MSMFRRFSLTNRATRKRSQLLLRQQLEQQRLVMEMTQRIRQSLNLQDILQTTVDEVRKFLQTDRVILFQFTPDWHGTVAVESCGDRCVSILSTEIYDPCFAENYVEPFRQGGVTAKSDIYKAGISDCHLELLRRFQVRANLVVPIIQNEDLWGLLIAHDCQAPRHWQDSEIALLRQIASQLSIAIQQSALLEQVQSELNERRRTEEQLHNLSDRLTLAVQSGAIGIWDWDVAPNILTWDDRMYALYGITPNQFTNIYDAWANRLHPDDRSIAERAIQQALLGQKDYDPEFRVIHPDGTIRYIKGYALVQRDAQGNPQHMIGINLDITERKQAEVVLRQNETTLQELNVDLEQRVSDRTAELTTLNNRLQQQTTQKQLLWNITQKIRQSLDLNEILNAAVEAVRQTLKVDRVAVYRFQPTWSGDFIAESVGDNWVKLVTSDVQTVWEDTYLQETQGGRFQNQETFVISDIYTSELQPCHIELLEQFQAKAYAVAPIFSGDRLWGLLAIYQNATARDWQDWEIELLRQIADQMAIAIQQAQLYSQLQVELQERNQSAAVLREAERRWRSLLDNVQLLVVGLNQSDQVNYANPFFLHLTGYTESEVMGRNWVDFLPSSNQTTVQSTDSYYQNSILTKAGEERFIVWNRTMLQALDGTVIGTISIGEDITERQKVERMKNEFIGIVSHELRTPLTAIQMSLGLLKTGIYAKKPEKVQRMIEIALLDTNRLVNLVNDILDLERLESGRAVLEKTVYQAADLMQQAVDGMQSIAAQQTITLAIAPTDATVWAAADTIIQTLTNLLSNAIKFSPANSTIHLRAEPQTDSVLFQVSDQGRGIPDDKLETIFGRFQQVDASDAREKGGTGLGLPICRGIIERHGGKIWAESVLGEGSSFFFTLPMPLDNNL